MLQFLKTSILFFLLSVTCGCSQNKERQQSHEGGNNPSSNHLIRESSPYLLQHAHNPVNWYAWGEEALSKAKRENKPLIISIGYAACHWCHVMERESFSDTAVASIMNRHFVAIKVDREERPDVDQVYMDAVQLIQGSGGWPLNAFALPDGRPFYAGTYYPKSDWKNLLKLIHQSYTQDYNKVVANAESLTKGISLQETILKSSGQEDQLKYNQVYTDNLEKLLRKADNTNGGFGGAPKFPLPAALEQVLEAYFYQKKPEILKFVSLTLDKMAMGGIYDQIGGGFARYSTDDKWKVPHFEKMLYDNGQLVALYAHAYMITHKPIYKNIIEQTLSFIERELTDKEGGFYSSLNADSEGEEGKYYVWQKEELDKIFDPATARLVADYFNVSLFGNWENKNILYLNKDIPSFAKKHKLENADLQKQILEWNAKLQKEREKRERPSTDDKILTSWNALMLIGYIEAYQALGNPQYLRASLKSAVFLEKMIQPSGELFRVYKEGKMSTSGFLDDYAFLCQAYISLYEVTLDKKWLDLAKKLTDFSITHFYNKESGIFFYTSKKSGNLVVRKMEIQDNVIPSSNSVMAHNLNALSVLFYDSTYFSLSETMLKALTPAISESPLYYSNWSRLVGQSLAGQYQIAIVGKESHSKAREMQKQYIPNAIFLGGEDENLPLLQNKKPEGEALIYICRNKSCKRPTTSPGEALKLLNSFKDD